MIFQGNSAITANFEEKKTSTANKNTSIYDLSSDILVI